MILIDRARGRVDFSIFFFSFFSFSSPCFPHLEISIFFTTRFYAGMDGRPHGQFIQSLIAQTQNRNRRRFHMSYPVGWCGLRAQHEVLQSSLLVLRRPW